jgi:CubicO group peptidase (beta-lactamase class C family)
MKPPCVLVPAILTFACAVGQAAAPDAHPTVPARIARGPERSAAGFDAARLDSLVRYLEEEVDSGAFPGAVVAVGRSSGTPFIAAVGRHGIDDPRPVDRETVYDLASLTKVVGLTTAVMVLAAHGKIDVGAAVQRYVPAFRGPWKEAVTVRHLLTHSSGLPAWRPLFTEATTRATALALVDTTALLDLPGRTTVYSDLGAIILTQAVEAIAGTRLDVYLDSAVFHPLGMTSTRFLPPLEWRDRVAPTERSQDGTIIRGTVHDENAWKLGGVSGHAGLFSTAPDLSRFAAWLLATRRAAASAGTAVSSGTPRVPPSITREFTRRQNVVAGSSRALGWDTPSERSSAGTRFSASSFGHTGFTGTSIWLDPERDLYVILLTNRVHPTRENARIYRVRPRVAELAVDALLQP